MIFKSTKSFYNLPCSHQQWMDACEGGEPGTGQCAQTHGYSREIHFEFSAKEVDDYGWVVGFSSLKKVKKWLEFLFDHTSLWEAGDPRVQKVKELNQQMEIPMYNMRIFPTGVSMEQTSLFLALFLNPYIMKETNNRCWISKIEVRENDKNSGLLEMTEEDTIQFQKYFDKHFTDYFPEDVEYQYMPPKELIKEINQA